MPEQKDRQRDAGKRLLTGLLNTILGLAGLFAVGAGLWYLVKGENSLALSGVGCGVLLLLLATVDRFEVIKGIGIEAKTRDLSREIDNAEQILAQIKDITVSFAPSLVRLAAHAGRWSGAQPPDVVYQLARSTDKLMTAAGADRHEVRQSLAPWAHTTATDITYWILNTTDSDAQSELTRCNLAANPPHGQPINAAEPAFVQARMQLKEVQDWMAVPQQLAKWSPAECAVQLKIRAASLPSYITAETAKKFKERVAAWAPELEYLAAHDDFRDSKAWIKKLNAIHAEAAGNAPAED